MIRLDPLDLGDVSINQDGLRRNRRVWLKVTKIKKLIRRCADTLSFAEKVLKVSNYSACGIPDKVRPHFSSHQSCYLSNFGPPFSVRNRIRRPFEGVSSDQPSLTVH